MKITIEIPDTTKAIIVAGAFTTSNGNMLAQSIINTNELKDGNTILCDWQEEENEHLSL